MSQARAAGAHEHLASAAVQEGRLLGQPSVLPGERVSRKQKVGLKLFPIRGRCQVCLIQIRRKSGVLMTLLIPTFE